MVNDIHKYDIIIVNNLLNLKIECYRLRLYEWNGVVPFDDEYLASLEGSSMRE